MTKQELPAPDPIKIPSRGRRMDFEPKKSSAHSVAPVKKAIKAPSSTANPTPKPVSRPASKSISKPAAAPAPKPTPKSASKPTPASISTPKPAPATITIRRLTPPPMKKSTEIISETGSPRRPAKHLRMDFVRHTTVIKTTPIVDASVPKPTPKNVQKPAQKPASNPAAELAQKPVQKPPVLHRAPISTPVKPVENSEDSLKSDKIPVRAPIAKKPFLKKIIQIVERPSEKPTERLREQPEEDTTRPQFKEPASQKPLAKKPIDSDLEPLMEDEDLAIALAGFVDEPEEDMAEDFNQTASEFEEEIDALDELDEIDQEIEEALRDEAHDFISEPKPLFEEAEEQSKKPDSPDANRYSLGGRSPFLTSVSVEKRPLSAYVPDSNINRLKPAPTTPVKNSYKEKVKTLLADSPKDSSHQTMIISVPTKSEHNSALTIAIILTVLLGALAGGLIYLIFFQ